MSLSGLAVPCEIHENGSLDRRRSKSAIFTALKKAGAGMAAPLVFAGAATNGWVWLESGALKIVSGVINTEAVQEDLAIALLSGGEDARV